METSEKMLWLWCGFTVLLVIGVFAGVKKRWFKWPQIVVVALIYLFWMMAVLQPLMLVLQKREEHTGGDSAQHHIHH